MASRTAQLPGLLKRALHRFPERIERSSPVEPFCRIRRRSSVRHHYGPAWTNALRRVPAVARRFPSCGRRSTSHVFVAVPSMRVIRKRNSLGGWLYRAALRLARRAQLAEVARSRRERFAVNNRTMTPPRDPGWDELCLVLDEELRRLPERYRIPLLLCYLEGRTQDEAAKQLDWSVRTLRRRLERARNLLKARMIRRAPRSEWGCSPDSGTLVGQRRFDPRTEAVDSDNFYGQRQKSCRLRRRGANGRRSHACGHFHEDCHLVGRRAGDC